MGLAVKSVVQYYFLTRNGLTKMDNIIDKTTASIQNHGKQQNKDFDTKYVHKFPFKVMVWVGITFQRVTGIVIFPQKTSFDAALS